MKRLPVVWLKRIYLAIPVLLLTCTGAFANTAGPNNPTVATGSGWANPSGIDASSSTASVSVAAGDTSNFLIGSSFGFSIPTASTINGIVASFAREQFGGSGQLETDQIFLTKTVGTKAGNAKSGGANWTGSLVTETYGTSGDLWGTTWTVADINSTGFGFVIDVSEIGGVSARTAGVQNFVITVYYTPPAAPVVARGVALFAGRSTASQERGIIVGRKRERGAGRVTV